MYNIEQIKKDLKKNLSEFRYDHSIMVAEESKKLAHQYHLDEEKAYVAGLVHDIAKEFSNEENVEWIEKYNLSKELLLPEFKKIIHADIGAVVVKEKYGLDEEICNAVHYHTIGNVPMELLDKIIFVADKIARKSNNPIIEQERNLAYKDIDKSLKLCLNTQKEKLERDGKKMHPITIQLLKELTK